MVIDLASVHAAAQCERVKQIHGVTLRVVSQEVAVGGKGSVTYPSLHVGPGESFPVRIEMQLMRPTQAVNGPLVEVNLDGVLFQEPFVLRPQPAELRADHEGRRAGSPCAIASISNARWRRMGAAGLQSAVLDSLVRQSQRPRLDALVMRAALRWLPAANPAQESTANFAFLNSPIRRSRRWTARRRSPAMKLARRGSRFRTFD